MIALLEMISRLDSAIRRLDRETDRSGLFEIAADLAQEARRLDSERGEQLREIEALTARLERLELIHRVGKTLIEVPCIEDSIQRVVDTVATALNYCPTAVLLLDPDLEELDLISAYGYGEVDGLRIPGRLQELDGLGVLPLHEAPHLSVERVLHHAHAGRIQRSGLDSSNAGLGVAESLDQLAPLLAERCEFIRPQARLAGGAPRSDEQCSDWQEQGTE